MTKTIESQKMCRVTDISLAAFLLATGYALVQIDGPANRREFVFRDVPDDAVVSFYSSTAQVNARQLLGALRDLRGLFAQRL